MDNYQPLVSIVIPVYNGSNFVGEAIDSALAQTYKNIEIIVVNDGSRDNGATEQVVKSYGDKVRYFCKENGGVSTALNYGIQQMRGEYFSWLSHDDLYEPNKVETQIADVIKVKSGGTNVERIMFYCSGCRINTKGKRLADNIDSFPLGIVNGMDALGYILKGLSIGGCGLLIPKRMFSEVGSFDETMRYMQDVFMWEQALLKGYSIFTNNSILVKTRIHGLQTSTTGAEYGKKDRVKVGNFLCETLSKMNTVKSTELLKMYMFICYKRGNTVIANKAMGILKGRGQITISDSTLVVIFRIYGNFRPWLVTLYYKLKFGTSR